jgi:hypothetical protein
MHLVVMAWLFVIGTMAMTSSSALDGIAFFAAAGVAPVALYAWILVRRLRRERSVREERVRRRDDADAGADQ